MPVFYVVNVKHGNSAVLVDKKGTIIFDSGRRTELLNFLTSKGINQIDVLLLSHADADHIGGAMALITSQKFTIKSVYVNSDIKDTKIFNDLIYCLYADKNIILEPSITPNLNGKLNQGDVEIEVLAPNQYLAVRAAGGKDRRGRTITSNTISAVIRLKYKDRNLVLLPGDIDAIGLENLLEDGKDIDARILIFPHHGGSPGGVKVAKFVEDICNKTNSETIIFSIDDNDKDYPRFDVVDCISKNFDAIRIFTTGVSNILRDFIQKNHGRAHRTGIGTIEIDFDKNPLIVN